MKHLLLLFLLPALAFSAELKTSWSTEFTGSFDGQEQIRLLLYRSESGKILGSYFNPQKLVRHDFKGTLNGNTVEFRVFKDSKETVHFKGNLLKDEKLILKGTYSKDGKSSDCTFTYYIHFPSVPGENIYSPIHADSRKAVEDFCTTLKKNILSKNKEAVADAMYFPLEAFLNNEPKSIESREEFLKNYDLIFSDEFVQRVKNNSFPMNMINSYKGVWFGFNKELVVQMMCKGDSPFRLKIAEVNNYQKK